MRQINRHLMVCLFGALSCFFGGAESRGDILPTKHNLSVSGPGTILSTTESRVCIFCHTPHHSTDVMPLWSRKLSNEIYNLYGSSSLVAQPGQPTGASRLCLSCHDGTISIGMLDGTLQPIELTGGVTTMPLGGSNLETDLSDDHPISFPYTSALAAQRGELRDPLSLPPEIRLEDDVLLQCTSCHNPHKDPYGMFLVLSQSASAICLGCHDKTGWSTSTHASDGRLSEQACRNCHQSHGAPGQPYLLKGATEEANCLTTCHNGSGEGTDIQASSSQIYNHPLNYATGTHDVMENPLTMDKHVECADCHNPHKVNNQGAPLANPPSVNGRLAGVRGIDVFGSVVAEANSEYEICFKCHAENAMVGMTPVIREIQTSNERSRFDATNPSFHPVTAMGKNPSVPSLRQDYTTSSQIYCTDCHGSDSSVKAGGSGANGPHGSFYRYILLAPYQQDYNKAAPPPYSSANYTLCFRCHDPDILFSADGSNFIKAGAGNTNNHAIHVQNKGVPCTACHDPHGVPVARGASTIKNAHLINFNTKYVTPDLSNPNDGYNSITRSCLVSCHQGPGAKTY